MKMKFFFNGNTNAVIVIINKVGTERLKNVNVKMFMHKNHYLLNSHSF